MPAAAAGLSLYGIKACDTMKKARQMARRARPGL
ncbi:arsenate reductase-like glutaredoxin family protein [Pseudomonas psychrotolerans]|nr:arsenate reductase-like glutaredoxin family protein [Pseudomonas psychrotolerans]